MSTEADLSRVKNILNRSSITKDIKDLAEKIVAEERLTPEEGEFLFEKGPLPVLGTLANYVREKKSGNKTYFNRNFHIEPTNVCVFSCSFCSYSRLYKHREDGWELSADDMLDMVKKYDDQPITEVHIVGGVHPKLNLEFFCEVIRRIKAHRPELHIKGFTAVELDYMFRKAKVSVEEGLNILKEAGLQSMPGGGAEIFHPDIRKKICVDKVDAEGWLKIHKAAHRLGMPTNATILYGHIENYFHRIDHMEKLRQLQDKTHGFNAFIPLKFRNKNNDMSYVPESTIVEDLKMYAVARLYLDNFPHIKAYWAMLGRQTTQLTLAYGVDDVDGTIDDTTKIYSMAGAEEQHPRMSTEELVMLIKKAGRIPIERDTVYHELHDYSEMEVSNLS
ncbi:MAG: aminofutalosine synthase MqnE [Chitinophagaceae bacterium]|jgi:aminodeoxyfutalosine synthase|nr:MAG: aminofutalosine synthase MqnE [Chitinophagaceae bacterium]